MTDPAGAVQVRADAGGPSGPALLLKVAARPGAARSAIQGVQGDALRVAVAAAPERGKANKELVTCVARALGLRRAQVALASGQTSRDKVLRIEGLDEPELRRRLAAALPTGPAAPR